MYSRGCRLLSSLNPRLRCSPGDWCCHLDVGKRVSQPKQGDRAVLLPLTSNNGKHKSLETLEKPSKHHRNRSSQLNQKSLQDLTSTKTYVGFNTCVKAAVPWCSMFFLSGFGVDLANTCEQGSLNNMFDIQKDRLNPLQSTQCKRPKESEKWLLNQERHQVMSFAIAECPGSPCCAWSAPIHSALPFCPGWQIQESWCPPVPWMQLEAWKEQCFLTLPLMFHPFVTCDPDLYQNRRSRASGCWLEEPKNFKQFFLQCMSMMMYISTI